MGWPLRMFQEGGYYFVTSRCFQGRLLLRPSAEVNEVVGGVLARAVQQSAGTIRLYAFTFASSSSSLTPSRLLLAQSQAHALGADSARAVRTALAGGAVPKGFEHPP